MCEGMVVEIKEVVERCLYGRCSRLDEGIVYVNFHYSENQTSYSDCPRMLCLAQTVYNMPLLL